MRNLLESMQYYLFRSSREKISLSLIHILMHKLVMLLKANIPIVQCVELLEKSEQSILMKRFLYFSRKELAAGKKISDSFLCFSDYVEPFFYQLLRLGEETGKFEWTAQQLVHYLGMKVQFQKKIQQALFYPIVILTLALLLFVALFVFVVPEFAALFKESNLSVPIYTQMMFNTACFMKKEFISFVCSTVVIGLIIVRLHVWSSIKVIIISLFARCRPIKKYREGRYLTEFCHQMATCLTAGVPLIESLTLIQLHGLYEEYQIITSLIRRIKSGVSLSVAMEEHHYFPVFLIEMVKIGESSGALEKMLLYLANYYQEELESFLMKLKTLIEPLIICILGVLIGCLVLSIYLPIFKLGSVWQ